MKALLSAAVLLAAPSTVAASVPAVAPQYTANLERSDSEAAAVAAHFLANAQADLAAQPGGAPIRASWAFDQNSPLAAPNAAGIVAHALVVAHGRFGAPRSLPAAKAWGEARLADLKADRPLFDPDIEALVALSAATGDARFEEAAAEAFERRHGGASGREIVERLFMVRKGAPGLVGFDAASSARAALAVGDEAKAREIVAALAETLSRWNVAGPQGFHHTSRAAALEVALLTGASKLSATLTRSLLSTQERDGSWGGRNTQATAYAARALARVKSPEASAAASRASRFLRLTQLTSGGWATFNDYLPEPFVGETVYEVSAEALLALAHQP